MKRETFQLDLNRKTQIIYLNILASKVKIVLIFK